LNGCNKKSKGAYRRGVTPSLFRPLCNAKSLRRQRDLTFNDD
jgi:hypothetical protein